MNILVGGWFSLPRLGRDVFSLLVKQGVVYDKSMGCFKIDSGTDIQAAVRTISAAVGQEVELTLRCFVCGRNACEGCPYLASCDRASVSTLCLCSDHSPEKSVFDLYAKTFAMVMDG
ncbi:MAG: hypothetical protein OK455_05280 [Thaumarchaeota archaeon]|nr:hypothetical protein [Nitrososphaerota archaeon]